MADPISRRLLARVAAGFLVLSGVLGMAMRIPASDGILEAAMAGPASPVAIFVGVLVWIAPWNRWPQLALVSVVIAALLLKAVGNLSNDVSLHAIHYVVLFMWIGIALPRWSSVGCAPALVLSYLTPFYGGGQPAGDPAAAIVVVPACIFVGELAGLLAGRLRAAEQLSQSRATKMALLVDATMALASCHEPEELARITALGAVDLHGADGALVLLEDSGRLEVAGRAAWEEEAEREILGPDAQVVLRRIVAEPDDMPGSKERDGLARAAGMERLEVLSLVGSRAVEGLALVGTRHEDGAVDQFTAYMARTLATQAGLAFERVRTAAALRDASLRDDLTGVGNRRAADAALEGLKPGDAVALIDLDSFKAVNDTYGHQAGDRVLQALGDFLRGSLRGPDQVFRFGGEEFLLILSGAGTPAIQALQRLRVRWAQLERVTTFSAGAALVAAGESPAQALQRADAALYVAKRAGRDRVVADGLGIGEDDSLEPGKGATQEG